MEKPKFTIVYNSVSEDGYVGVCWEFFTKEHKAQARYDFLAADEKKYCPTKRPYYHDTDKHHLGAGHWELKNSPNIFDKQEETRNKSLELLDKFISETPKKELDALIKKYHGIDIKVNKWDKLNAEFEKALEKFDEWTPRDRKPIEAAKNNEKIYKLADDYVKKNTLESAEHGVKMFCKNDFIAGFFKCQEIQSEITNHIKKLLNREEETEPIIEKSIMDEFFESTSLEMSLKTSIIMHDYDNWKNGDYNGKMHEVMPHIMEKIVEHHIEFAEYLHKYYPNIMKPENYREVPAEKGKRKWMNAFLSDNHEEGTTEELYVKFINYKKNENENKDKNSNKERGKSTC